MNKRTKTVQIVIGVVVAIVLLVIVVVIVRSYHGRGDLRQAIQALSQASTFHAASDLKLTLPLLSQGKERPFNALDIKVEGDVTRGGPTPELTGTVYMEAKGRGSIFFADGDVRLLKDATAFRLENLPVLLNPTGNLLKKWTYVPVPVLASTNPPAIQTVVNQVIQKLSYRGQDKIEGVSTLHFSGTVTPVEEQQIHDVLEQKTSGNRALNIIARLLNGGDIKSIEVWVDKSTHEIPRFRLSFVHPVKNSQPVDFATLDLSFTDYGKKVTITRPPQQSTAKPDVFAKLFGTGQVTSQ